MSCETLAVYPDEIQFLDVRPNQTYIQTVEVPYLLRTLCVFPLPTCTRRLIV